MSKKSSRVPESWTSLQLSTDDTNCHILHADMDAFYASVELIERPELIGTPVIVGGQDRGVVLAATYEARAFGVHAAMSMTRARRLCPQATVIRPQHEKYSEVSRGVMEIFRSITPHVEPLSLDEAFLDVSGALRRLGSASSIGQMIRDRVADEQGIPCSVGVASVKFVAKLASARAKPDGLLVVPHAETLPFLHSLPIEALWGVGEKTAEQLHRFGIKTVAQLAHTPVGTVKQVVGEAAGAHLYDLAWGIDKRTVHPERVERSVGAEETFERDVDEAEFVHRELLRLSEKVARRLRHAGMTSRTLTIKVRFSDFTTITRSKTLTEPTDVAQVVYATSRGLFDALGLQRARVRLVGVRATALIPQEKGHHQLALDERSTGWKEADVAKDQARARFGPDAILPASLVLAEADRLKRKSPDN